MTELKDYLLKTPDAKIIYTDNELHPLLKNKVIAKVCLETDENYQTGQVSKYWVLFINGEMVTNSVKTRFPIPDEFNVEIAKALIEEYKSYCDFEDLDKELNGECACDVYKGTYSKCDECPKYYYGAGKEKEDSCLGATYKLPHHINFWKLEKELEDKYGKGTENYSHYLRKRCDKLCYLVFDLIKEDDSLKKELKKRLLHNIRKIK